MKSKQNFIISALEEDAPKKKISEAKKKKS